MSEGEVMPVIPSRMLSCGASGMSLITKAWALLIVVSRSDVEQLCPVERARLIEDCKRVIRLAESVPNPNSGVLAELAAKRREG